MVALGSNRAGPWGPPPQTLQRACKELCESGLDLVAASHLYTTAPMGPGLLEAYANAVVIVRGHLPPRALLRRLKAIERRAGSRSAMPWGPRSLDLDIIDYKGRVLNWAPPSLRHSTRRRRLVLPHASAHLRPFVMAPLAEVAPAWRHPVLKRTAIQLSEALKHVLDGRILVRTHRLH